VKETQAMMVRKVFTKIIQTQSLFGIKIDTMKFYTFWSPTLGHGGKYINQLSGINL